MRNRTTKQIFIIAILLLLAVVFPDSVKASWQYNDKGWRWEEQQNSYVKNQWKKVQDKWYFFGSNGYMKSGWQHINGSWYYLGGTDDGAMKYGWQYIDGNWYYLGGAEDGAMKYGWQYIDGNWYYLGGAEDGAMKYGWQYIGGNWYYFGAGNDGAMKYDWKYIDGNWYYFGSVNDGSMKYGWQYIDGFWYYFGGSEDGSMKTGSYLVNDVPYYFHGDGHMATIVTQYSDATGNQSSFYTIETEQGKLIVVDGGWNGNAEFVRSVIKEKGNHVDAWVISHPHPDHVGAFNTLLSDGFDFTVDTIYTIEVDYNVYKACAQPWDGFESYEIFYDLTKDMSNIEYLYAGDILDIGGCKINIYSAFDEETVVLSTDVCNVGSLIFEVFGREESILFCSDTYGAPICNQVIENYREELQATYLQMGHHGNNTVTHAFVDVVDPSAAFFDAPGWLVNGEGYDAKENMEYLKSKGAKIYSFATTPNRVFLR